MTMGTPEQQCSVREPHSSHTWGDALGTMFWCNGVSSNVEPTKVLTKWADPAMFTAEPSDAADGPRVYLLWMTPDPLGAIAATCKMYKGEVVRSLADVTDAERREYLEQVQRTKLKAPFEFVKFHFLIEGVTRAFTHQMVRQRTAVYAQESLRFAVKEDMADAVALPPSLTGVEGGYGNTADGDMHLLYPEEQQRAIWDGAVEEVERAYLKLINMGMPAEDARGLLPHNITTRLHYATDLRALLDHAGNRLCTQAMFEWRLVFARIVEAIRDYDAVMHHDAYGRDVGTAPRWDMDLLSQMFNPVCYQTGKCEFKANFDRACSIRDRVDLMEEYRVPSELWDDPVAVGAPSVIRPEEWLADPGAAR